MWSVSISHLSHDIVRHICQDALEYLADIEYIRQNFDAIHASPPCQLYSLSTPEFVEAWTRLNSISKWRNKPASAVELALQKLSHYEVAFAVELCDAAHAGNYQGVVFPDTQSKYEQWKKRNAHDQNTRSNGQNIGFRERALTDIAELDAKFARTNTR